VILRCGINTCKTKWLWFGFFYLRINPFRRQSCLRGSMIVSRNTWKTTRAWKAKQALKRAIARS
jgi:hypothetical protein